LCSKNKDKHGTHVDTRILNTSRARATSRSRRGPTGTGCGSSDPSRCCGTGQALRVVVALALTGVSRHTARRAGPANSTTLAVSRALGISSSSCCRRGEGDESRLHLRRTGGDWKQFSVKESLLDLGCQVLCERQMLIYTHLRQSRSGYTCDLIILSILLVDRWTCHFG
jgi:hypothetical protein